MRGARCIKQLLEHSKKSYISAIDTYNRIGSVCRIEGFVFYMTNAWELILKARMIQLSGDVKCIYSKTKHGNRQDTKSIDECIKYVFQNEIDPVRRNIEWISELRNEAVHFMISELESIYISYFQSSAINYSGCLEEWFAIDINKEFDFPILSLFTLTVDKIVDVKTLKGKYDKNVIDFVVEQQTLDREIRKSDIDNTKARMYVPVEYKAAIVKNPNDADMLFGKEGDKRTHLLFVDTPKDVDKTHPYVFADVNHRLQEKFDYSVFPLKGKLQAHDLMCVTTVNHLNDNQRYVYRLKKPVVIRYSELFMNYMIANIEKNSKFLFTMRERYRKEKSKERK
ncbi:hypothetical protein HMPREF7215_0140 [Pyramidobacter piscolens W5455]|uniref:DUF3644 domain-containing protein n=1 Tax=Pyramidobacter piscolens W5455 TaxID=352165 RepID=A0ABM9ZR35_9BACT|nr:DUF3644 domain-containing protein [Pyramidobacter piscolens]EFB89377.1 hypothetical protein HMPREF7215_0140 [Pyramidobacter piscolens W5455]